MPTRSLAVPDGLDGLRLDTAVSRLFGLSRTTAAELVSAGSVSLDGSLPAKADRVSVGAWLEIRLPEPAQPRAAEPVAGLLVVYDDDDVVVVDKPPGVAAHPSPGWEGPTVTAGLAATGRMLARSGPAERQGVVHRLDVGTTGLMVLAKSDLAYRNLKGAFRDRSVGKHYRALVQGHPDPSGGTIDAPIGRHPSHEHRFAVVSAGRPSITHYSTVEALRAASLLDVSLETGRTHQIRVHFGAMRHPCVGDLTYGADPVLAAHVGLTRQALHAAELSFEHPRTGQLLRFTSELPDDLAAALQRLRAEP